MVYLVVYIAARLLVSWPVGGRLIESRLNVHPLILIPGVVVLSQIGPILLLLSAPILAFGSDLVRYLHGRLSEPPRPAGLLPGEPLPAARTAAGRPVRSRRLSPAPPDAAPSRTRPAPSGVTPTRHHRNRALEVISHVR